MWESYSSFSLGRYLPNSGYFFQRTMMFLILTVLDLLILTKTRQNNADIANTLQCMNFVDLISFEITVGLLQYHNF